MTWRFILFLGILTINGKMMAKSKIKFGKKKMNESGIWNEEEYQLILGRIPGESGIQFGNDYYSGLSENIQYYIKYYECIACGPDPYKIGYGIPIYPDIENNIYIYSNILE